MTLHVSALDQDPRWTAVAARDREADGRFVYSVETTGVFCRPSCPSRAARPENVRFHPTPQAAEAAGYRACLRCRPTEPPAAVRQAALIGDACRLIEAAETPPPLAALAEAAGLSPHHFHRVFKAATGLTPRAYAAGVRARRVREALPTAATVTDAIYQAGFNSGGRFYAGADAALGMTPSELRRGAPASEIRFAVGQCSLGAVLVARTDRGVCAILLGDDPDALLRELQDRFPRARLLGADPAFEAEVAAVVDFVEAPRLGLDLPLDVQGTAFQQRVWAALQAIPPGVTATYAEIARAIGAPDSVRAVGSACGANPVAVAIPCHRVVRTDGGLSGYRWGVERKRALLDREAGEIS
jgi:AraC family transcriptional regulator of adaptative response/methylated-DNA-[protein]-cysteine methyltransferase